MDRDSRFLLLSGLSGGAAGICGLTGAFFAQQFILQYTNGVRTDMEDHPAVLSKDKLVLQLSLIAFGTLVATLLLGFLFTYRKTKRSRLPLCDIASRKLFFHLLLPLASGGGFIAGMLSYHEYHFIVSASLIFYGLSLVNASKYKLPEIQYLGILQIILGWTCLFFLHYSLYFWAIGFGVLHIIYWLIM